MKAIHLLLAALALGCSGNTIGPSDLGDGQDDPSGTSPTGNDSRPRDPTDSPSSPSGTGPGEVNEPTPSGNPSQQPGPGDPAAPGVTSPSAPGEIQPSYLPARIRRMTNSELVTTAQQLLGISSLSSEAFVPDTRQSGFTRNEAQIVDPLFARQLQQNADRLAREFVESRLASAVPCASAGDAACARSFFAEFLPQAYRRPLEAGELDALLDGVYAPAAASAGFAKGLELALSASLQSAAFIYHTELGEGANATELTPSETATALSYLLTGQPPDETLRNAAESGAITSAQTRESEARRLLATPAARTQVSKLIKEWLGIDAVVNIGKDQAAFPNYDALRPHMLAETDAFINEVVFNDGGSLGTLLTADYTLVGREMADFYGIPAPSGSTPTKVSLAQTNRRGILSHASFLARYATEVDSAPIRRGLAVARRVMCIETGDPTDLDIDVVPPQPQPGQTTRERFTQHTIDPTCAGCHGIIDGLGFTFEGYDAMGSTRTQEHGKNVDTATELPSHWVGDLDQSAFADSADLAATLARAESVKRCFSRHLARHAGAVKNVPNENYFLSQWEQLELTQRDNLLEVLVSYVSSDVFVRRVAGGSR